LLLVRSQSFVSEIMSLLVARDRFTRPMLWYALVEAGLAPPRGGPRAALRTLATRWLAGELERKFHRIVTR
jgi:hypothetical protein